MSVDVIYVEKKSEFAVAARAKLADLKEVLQLPSLTNVRIINRYLVENLSPEHFAGARDGIFSEPSIDIVYATLPQDIKAMHSFAVEYLPGQYDQRADATAQCIAMANGTSLPLVSTAKIYLLEGDITKEQFDAIKTYIINPVDSRETTFDIPKTLELDFEAPAQVESISGFIAFSREELLEFHRQRALAMDFEDLLFCQQYFVGEKRDPTITELKMIDTYWSDHCRHTTFLTRLEDIEIESDYIAKSFDKYEKLRKENYGAGNEKPMTLMDLATIGARELRRQGLLNRLDDSEEINACSVSILAKVGDQDQNWLLMFKNETHNHPTEIEPFGGAATCLGGAIRDPLSGRSYVYQAMRLSGAGNPLESAKQTRKGKLPQRKIVREAAEGYSSYGNQIGLATGLVHEIYHKGYTAKRMEVGVVVGAAPQENVIREIPAEGDVVILLGGRTGRDGCGGATGSSKSHNTQSLQTSGAEVQKGNAPEERKIQRLFRDGKVTKLIKRCNDFGAGGVSVAIGELADGLRINLDAVPKKYDGLDGTELAISESQERMAVVVAPQDAAAFIEYAACENLEATAVAVVSAEKRLIMEWQGRVIVDVSREFLNSNGAPKYAKAKIAAPQFCPVDITPIDEKILCEMLSSLKFCAQIGLGESFDSTVGAGTVLLPYSGRYQLTPSQAMVAKLPVLGGDVDTCSVTAWGFDPELSTQSPYHGAIDAVIHSVAKIIAAGGSRKKCWLSFQEYYERLGKDPVRWGKPLAALLGAMEAQIELGVGAIGGKDSMSGSFEELDVPPTLISFAVSAAEVDNIIPTGFQRAGSVVYFFTPCRNCEGLVDFDDTRIIFDLLEQFIAEKHVISAWAVSEGGTAEGVAKMCFGNRIGFEADALLTAATCYGGMILEADAPIPNMDAFIIGRTIKEYIIKHNGENIDLAKVESAWRNTLEPVFATVAGDRPELKIEPKIAIETFSYHAQSRGAAKVKLAKPKVLIPVFPGTNCEYDTAAAFEKAGAQTEIFVVKNLTPAMSAQSVEAFAKALLSSQILAIPGGFSYGDEPEGSAKFITSFIRSPQIAQALQILLEKNDGLVCGICNGFQALIKLGLLPFGEIRPMTSHSPTLAFNTIGRHQSKMVRTRICSTKSPWLSRHSVGDVFTVPVSHGEGCFVADEMLVKQLAENGQIATQYVDFANLASCDIAYNPNGSLLGVEGITSPDGRIFGKMAHVERYGNGLYKNHPDSGYMDIFSGAVEYYY